MMISMAFSLETKALPKIYGRVHGAYRTLIPSRVRSSFSLFAADATTSTCRH